MNSKKNGMIFFFCCLLMEDLANTNKILCGNSWRERV